MNFEKIPSATVILIEDLLGSRMCETRHNTIRRVLFERQNFKLHKVRHEKFYTIQRIRLKFPVFFALIKRVNMGLLF